MDSASPCKTPSATPTRIGLALSRRQRPARFQSGNRRTPAAPPSRPPRSSTPRNTWACFAVASQLEPNAATRSQYAGMARDMLLWLMNQENGDLVSACSLPRARLSRRRSHARPRLGVCRHRRLHLHRPQRQRLRPHWTSLPSLGQGAIHQRSHQLSIPAARGRHRQPLHPHQQCRAPALGPQQPQHRRRQRAAASKPSPSTRRTIPTIGYCAGGRETLCADGSANSMHAYIKAFTGAWLLRQYAEYEDKGMVAAAYTRWLHTPVPASLRRRIRRRLFPRRHRIRILHQPGPPRSHGPAQCRTR